MGYAASHEDFLATGGPLWVSPRSHNGISLVQVCVDPCRQIRPGKGMIHTPHPFPPPFHHIRSLCCSAPAQSLPALSRGPLSFQWCPREGTCKVLYSTFVAVSACRACSPLALPFSWIGLLFSKIPPQQERPWSGWGLCLARHLTLP